MSKSPLESTWLYHEIGRCYLELQRYQDARDFGEKAIQAAKEAEDDGWQLHASVLVAQSEGKSSYRVKLNENPHFAKVYSERRCVFGNCTLFFNSLFREVERMCVRLSKALWQNVMSQLLHRGTFTFIYKVFS